MKKIVSVVTMAVALFACLLSVSTAAETEMKKLNFGIISTESTANLKEGFEPFIQELEKKLGMKVHAFFATDYAGVIEAMRFKKVDFAWFGNKSAMEAVDRANGEVFAQCTGDDGSLGYNSLILVQKDSPYQNIEEIIAAGKDLKFGNGDPNSTSGYLIPSYYIWAKHNIDPNKYFKITRSANHESNALAVATKQVDFATNNTENMERFAVTNPELAKEVRVIWTSPEIPKDPLVWRKDLPRDIKTKIQAAILGFGRVGDNTEKELAILHNLSGGWGTFLTSDNRQLLPIRELEIAKNIKKIEGNDKINKTEKDVRIAQLTDEQKNLVQFIQLSDFWNSPKEQ